MIGYMVRVLIAAGVFPPEPGGPATYAKIISEALPERGIEVTVFPFREVRKYPKILRHMMYLLLTIKRARKVDVILALDAVSVGLPARIAALILRKKFVLRVAGDYAWEQGSQRFGVRELLDQFVTRSYAHPAIGVLRCIQSWVSRSAHRVIVPSKYFRGIVETWGVSGDSIEVVHSAFVPIARISQEKDDLKMLYRFPTPTIITAGRLVPWKGMRTLIELVPSLLEEFPDVLLLIVSDGPEYETLKSRIAELGLESHVRLLGSLKHEVFFPYIKASDVFVLNTGYEGLSYHLLEVMSIGTPIITTEVGGNPELIENGVDGILVQYDNKAELREAISGVLSGRIKTEEMCMSAHRRVQDFSSERMIEGTIKVLQSV